MTKYKKPNELAWRTISGQAYIIDTRTSILHECNEAGSFIWDLLGKNLTPENIAKRVSEAFEVSEEKALEDIHVFMNELKQKGLIEFQEK